MIVIVQDVAVVPLALGLAAIGLAAALDLMYVSSNDIDHAKWPMVLKRRGSIMKFCRE